MKNSQERFARTCRPASRSVPTQKKPKELRRGACYFVKNPRRVSGFFFLWVASKKSTPQLLGFFPRCTTKSVCFCSLAYALAIPPLKTVFVVCLKNCFLRAGLRACSFTKNTHLLRRTTSASSQFLRLLLYGNAP